MRVICVGHSTYDITFPVEGYPKENIKYRIDNSVQCGGGPASNGAYLLAKWGVDTTIASIVGDDYYGKMIFNEFTKNGVDTTFLEMHSDYNTSTSFILANVLNGKRTIFTAKSKHLRKLDNSIDLLFDVVLIDGEHPDTAKEVLKNNPNAISILDAGRVNDDTKMLGKMVDYVVCSHDFAEEFTHLSMKNDDLESLSIIYNKLKTFFNTNIVITLESSGCFTMIDGTYKIVPSIAVHAVDSTGAGDIFHGAFTYFMGMGYGIEKALRYACITGALSTTMVGSRLSVPKLEDVLNYDKSI